MNKLIFLAAVVALLPLSLWAQTIEEKDTVKVREFSDLTNISTMTGPDSTLQFAAYDPAKDSINERISVAAIIRGLSLFNGIIGSTQITNGSILDTDISGSAGIGLNKLATTAAGRLLLTDSGGAGTWESGQAGYGLSISGTSIIADTSSATGLVSKSRLANALDDISSGGGSGEANYKRERIAPYWTPGSLADSYGLEVDWSDTTTIDAVSTLRCEFPSLALNQETGRLAVVYRLSNDHVFTADAVLICRYSDNLGQTWSSADTLYDDGASGNDPQNNTLTWDRQTGKFFLAIEEAPSGYSGVANPNTNIIIQTSEDAITWTAIDTITKAEVVASGYCGIGINGEFLRATNGNLLFPYYTRFESDCTTASRAIQVAISTDDGESWSHVNIDATAVRDLNEVNLYLTSGGRIYAFARSEDNQLWRFYSDDNGATWAGDTDVSPGNYIRTKPSLAFFPDNRILAIYRSDASTFVPQYAMSDDFGTTWTTDTDLPNQHASYNRFYYSDFEPLGQNISAVAYSLANASSEGSTRLYFRYVTNGANSVSGVTRGLSRAVATTATQTQSIDLNYRSRKADRINVSSLDTLNLTVSNPVDGGNYIFHFNNDAGSVFYNFPATFLDISGSALDTTLANDWLIDCYYIESEGNYYCEEVVGESTALSLPVTANLFYHFDASDSIFNKSDVLASNLDSVKTWTDRSGNNYDAVQTTSGKYPVYLATGGPSSKPCVDFNGTSSYLATSTHSWTSDSVTMFVVCAFDDATRNASEIVAGRYETSTNERQFNFWGQNTAAGYKLQFVRDPLGTGVSAKKLQSSTNLKHTSFKLHSITATDSSNSWYTNGSLITLDDFTETGAIFDATISFAMGTQNSSTGGAAFFDGKIAEVIVYNAALSASDRAEVESYLNNKYTLY